MNSRTSFLLTRLEESASSLSKEAEVEYHGKTFPGYNKPISSDKKDKKMMVLAKKGDEVKLVHFGQKGYQHNYSPEAKQNYLTRSAGIRDKGGNLTKDDPFSPNYWARKVLWPKGETGHGHNGPVNTEVRMQRKEAGLSAENKFVDSPFGKIHDMDHSYAVDHLPLHTDDPHITRDAIIKGLSAAPKPTFTSGGFFEQRRRKNYEQDLASWNRTRDPDYLRRLAMDVAHNGDPLVFGVHTEKKAGLASFLEKGAENLETRPVRHVVGGIVGLAALGLLATHPPRPRWDRSSRKYSKKAVHTPYTSGDGEKMAFSPSEFFTHPTTIGAQTEKKASPWNYAPLIGGAIGAATGAGVGAARAEEGARGRGALRGAAAGGAVGGLAGLAAKLHRNHKLSGHAQAVKDWEWRVGVANESGEKHNKFLKEEIEKYRRLASDPTRKEHHRATAAGIAADVERKLHGPDRFLEDTKRNFGHAKDRLKNQEDKYNRTTGPLAIAGTIAAGAGGGFLSGRARVNKGEGEKQAGALLSTLVDRKEDERLAAALKLAGADMAPKKKWSWKGFREGIRDEGIPMAGMVGGAYLGNRLLPGGSGAVYGSGIGYGSGALANLGLEHALHKKQQAKTASDSNPSSFIPGAIGATLGAGIAGGLTKEEKNKGRNMLAGSAIGYGLADAGMLARDLIKKRMAK